MFQAQTNEELDSLLCCSGEAIRPVISRPPRTYCNACVARTLPCRVAVTNKHGRPKPNQQVPSTQLATRQLNSCGNTTPPSLLYCGHSCAAARNHCSIVPSAPQPCRVVVNGPRPCPHSRGHQTLLQPRRRRQSHVSCTSDRWQSRRHHAASFRGYSGG